MENLTEMNFSLFEHALAILAVGAALAVILWLAIKSIRKRGKNRILTIQAAVQSKSESKYVNQPLFMQDKQVTAGFVESGKIYTVFFKTKDNQELDFTVSKRLFDMLEEGQEELLVYKGAELIRFGSLENENASEGGAFKGLREDL